MVIQVQSNNDIVTTSHDTMALFSLNEESVTSTSETLIDNLGVSKKLGNSVLNELDSRTTEKLDELKETHTTLAPKEDTNETSFEQYFGIKHNLQFNRMDSIGHHYMNNIPKTPTKKNLTDQQLQSESIKRQRVEQNSMVKNTPVTEITRRIRRLRIRNSIANNNNSNGNSNINSVRNTPLSKPKPMQPPSFLRPTLNSLNKIKESSRSTSTFDLSRQKSTTTKTLNTNSKSKPATTTTYRSTSGLPKSSSVAVFDRLYKQSTVSRLTSMNNLNDNIKTNAKSVIPPPTTRSKIQFGRSKTSSSLSSNLKDSSSSSRPAWR
ncbi:hypothetical protein KAFR_0H01170 [Kazachstania africana CBS 2517]|uniref:Uncharacterized protein n=1 Tax=Kazachstania africana (strain ATCC 22294 / BCRC 22015 / CBS 2517 / CECT 1963 / NBRC 1671 / NRRL Y-8276) TaxID=1071382 RepID=H2AYX1_KAZAF|nr:hypothetical protein KAFR_0H01170 [Kazachstania africana CBS 2517]CCF59527.1 hypothetical protein KAFR_0H01170 [Kazachstania africana CBS 2517]